MEIIITNLITLKKILVLIIDNIDFHAYPSKVQRYNRFCKLKKQKNRRPRYKTVIIVAPLFLRVTVAGAVSPPCLPTI
jgi:hypothetical protein